MFSHSVKKGKLTSILLEFFWGFWNHYDVCDFLLVGKEFKSGTSIINSAQNYS